jgi:hypothetical protein
MENSIKINEPSEVLGIIEKPQNNPIKIGIVGHGNIPTSLIKEAEERGVEIIQTEEKEYERTEFMDKVYTMHALPKLEIPFFEDRIPHYGHGKGGRTDKQIKKDRKKNKNKKTHRR